jgi:(p)ppGpp synthase/HD superfamily hydrolase
MSSPESCLLRLRVVADADPGALARVLEQFQNLNVVPRRVVAEFATNDKLHMQVDIFGLTADRLTLIAAQIAETPAVISSYWHAV